ncbi:ABC transporter ATP-binding protein [Granulicoccus phenolivorans]|uniref:ABC transporter ATP-binding protein n=1 Tax=Granulicoccus phenolivorans TaxID=266854 RepID=UPI0004024C85|nr:ABC transporter ATP-binding protein [Granulicoccus phenolivorans]
MRIELTDWGWRHAARTSWAVRDITCTIEAGERVLLLGASGSGKSTLLHALAGVLGGGQEGDETGTMLLDGKHPTRQRGRVGLVLQDPDASVVLARVGDDVAFGLENLGVPAEEIWPRVRAALDTVGLGRLPLDRPTEWLSGGQQQRLAIAGALAMRTPVLLLDEPTANLDPAGIRDVRDALGRIAADTTVILVEHRPELWLDLVDRVIVLGPDCGILADGAPAQVFTARRAELLAAGVWVPGAELPDLGLPAYAPGPDLLTTEDLAIGYDTPVRSGLDLGLPAATATAITGPNGAGKTTLALTLAGLLPRLGGRIRVAEHLQPPARRRRFGRTPDPHDPGSWRAKDLLTRIGTVFQHPEHQFVAATVADELAVGLHALGHPKSAIDARVAELLAVLHLDRLAGANPFSLSGGQKRRLSVGTVLATEPELIFLDEPTFGQDRRTWIDLVRLIGRILGEGRAVVSVTHDPDFLALLGRHRIEVAG